MQHTLHYALHARSAATILLNQNQSMSSVLQKIISLAESEASSDSKKAVKRTRDTDDYIFQSSLGKLIRPCRDDKYFRTRWREGYCRDLAEKENSFIAEYRLDPVSFDLQSEMLAPDLGVNEAMANLSSKSGLITNHSRLGCALIILAGGRRIEAMRTHGVSQSFTYYNLRSVVRAINSNPNLKIKCDTSSEALRTRASNFKALGDYDLFQYCVGAIDGLAIKTRTPNRNSYKNTARFMSGSKKMVCINMQAVCQSDLQFVAVTCKHVGCTNDAIAFETSSLRDVCNSLPFPYHWIGDNAYTLNETMIVPFLGQNLHKTHPYLEAFNFYQSQLRITIECAFGVLVRRWGILWKAMEYDLEFQFEIVHACCRLHNFCISRRLLPIQIVSPPSIIATNENGSLSDSSWHLPNSSNIMNATRTGSTLRSSIVNTLRTKGITRIRSHNLQA